MYIIDQAAFCVHPPNAENAFATGCDGAEGVKEPLSLDRREGSDADCDARRHRGVALPDTRRHTQSDREQSGRRVGLQLECAAGQTHALRVPTRRVAWASASASRAAGPAAHLFPPGSTRAANDAATATVGPVWLRPPRRLVSNGGQARERRRPTSVGRLPLASRALAQRVCAQAAAPDVRARHFQRRFAGRCARLSPSRVTSPMKPTKRACRCTGAPRTETA